jgi:hypothetical protein
MIFWHSRIQGQPSPGPVFTGKHHHCGLHGSRCNFLSQQQGGPEGRPWQRWRRNCSGSCLLGALSRTLVLKSSALPPLPVFLYMSDWGLMESWLEKTHFWLLMATVRLHVWSLGLSVLLMRFVCFVGRVALWEEMEGNNTSGLLFFFLATKQPSSNFESQVCYWKVTLRL